MNKQKIIIELYDKTDYEFMKFCKTIDNFLFKLDKKIDQAIHESCKMRYRIIDENNQVESKTTCSKENYTAELKKLKEKFA